MPKMTDDSCQMSARAHLTYKMTKVVYFLGNPRKNQVGLHQITSEIENIPNKLVKKIKNVFLT